MSGAGQVRLFLGSNGLGALRGFIGADPAGLDLVFVPTAANPLPERSFLEKDLRVLRELGFGIRFLDIESAPRSEMEAEIDDADVIFVEGGSSFYLLEQAVATGFAAIVARAVRAGTPYVGMSAGAVIAGPDIASRALVSDPGLAPGLASTTALGLVDYVVYPHYDDECAAIYPQVVDEFGGRFKLIPLTDRQALVVEDGRARVVRSD